MTINNINSNFTGIDAFGPGNVWKPENISNFSISESDSFTSSKSDANWTVVEGAIAPADAVKEDTKKITPNPDEQFVTEWQMAPEPKKPVVNAPTNLLMEDMPSEYYLG